MVDSSTISDVGKPCFPIIMVFGWCGSRTLTTNSELIIMLIPDFISMEHSITLPTTCMLYSDKKVRHSDY